MKPINNPDSPCFGCTAFMCGDACRGEQYFWELENGEKPEKEAQEEPKTEEYKLQCPLCNYEYANHLADFKFYPVSALAPMAKEVMWSCPSCKEAHLLKTPNF